MYFPSRLRIRTIRNILTCSVLSNSTKLTTCFRNLFPFMDFLLNYRRIQMQMSALRNSFILRSVKTCLAVVMMYFCYFYKKCRASFNMRAGWAIAPLRFIGLPFQTTGLFSLLIKDTIDCPLIPGPLRGSEKLVITVSSIFKKFWETLLRIRL